MQSFAMRNDGTIPFNLSQVQFIRGETIAPVNTIERILEPNECLVVVWSNQSRGIPDNWHCENTISEARLESNALFWRLNTAQDETFNVKLGDQLLVTCPTIRTADATCAFEWIFDVSEED
jgi:hypothetical protein